MRWGLDWRAAKQRCDGRCAESSTREVTIGGVGVVVGTVVGRVQSRRGRTINTLTFRYLLGRIGIRWGQLGES